MAGFLDGAPEPMDRVTLTDERGRSWTGRVIRVDRTYVGTGYVDEVRIAMPKRDTGVVDGTAREPPKRLGTGGE